MSNKAKLLLAIVILSALVWGQEPKLNTEAQPQAGSQAAPAVPPDSTKLKVLKSVKPIYPEQAREKRIQGEVMLKVAVNEKGDVEEAEVLSGDPILAPAALDAVKKWKFEPFIKNGKLSRWTPNYRSISRSREM